MCDKNNSPITYIIALECILDDPFRRVDIQRRKDVIQKQNLRRRVKRAG